MSILKTTILNCKKFRKIERNVFYIFTFGTFVVTFHIYVFPFFATNISLYQSVNLLINKLSLLSLLMDFLYAFSSSTFFIIQFCLVWNGFLKCYSICSQPRVFLFDLPFDLADDVSQSSIFGGRTFVLQTLNHIIFFFLGCSSGCKW